MVRYINDELGGDASHSGHQPKWMSDVHDVFYCDPLLVVHQMLANPDYKGGMDFSPYRAFDKDGARQYQHLMSGDWAWDQAASPLPFYYELLFQIFSSQSLNVGQDSPRSNNAWRDVRSHCFRKRQNNSISSNGSDRLLPIVLIHKEPSQQYSPVSLWWSCTYRIPCNCQKWVFSPAFLYVLTNLYIA